VEVVFRLKGFFCMACFTRLHFYSIH